MVHKKLLSNNIEGVWLFLSSQEQMATEVDSASLDI